jgi:hypothetical protein
LLEKQLILGQATPADVQIFLKEQGLGYVDISSKSSVSDNPYLINEHYDTFMECFSPAPVKRWLFWTIETYWKIRFHFWENKLVKIFVILVEDDIG